MPAVRQRGGEIRRKRTIREPRSNAEREAVVNSEIARPAGEYHLGVDRLRLLAFKGQVAVLVFDSEDISRCHASFQRKCLLLGPDSITVDNLSLYGGRRKAGRRLR